MNRHVNAVAGRLSLRAPQRRSLEILDRVTEIVPPRKGTDIGEALAAIRGEFGSVTDLERLPFAVFCASYRRGEDAADGSVYQLSASGAWCWELLCAGAESDDLQQIDRGLHAEYSEVCFQGNIGIRDGCAGDYHGR